VPRGTGYGSSHAGKCLNTSPPVRHDDNPKPTGLRREYQCAAANSHRAVLLTGYEDLDIMLAGPSPALVAVAELWTLGCSEYVCRDHYICRNSAHRRSSGLHLYPDKGSAHLAAFVTRARSRRQLLGLLVLYAPQGIRTIWRVYSRKSGICLGGG